MRAYAFEWGPEHRGWSCGGAVVVAGNVAGARKWLRRYLKRKRLTINSEIISTSPGPYWTKLARGCPGVREPMTKPRVLYFYPGRNLGRESVFTRRGK